MRRFPENRAIQLEACITIWNICTGHAKNRRLCGELNALDAVCDCIRLFLPKHDIELYTEACIAVDKICMGDKENTKKLGEIGGIKLLVDAMVEFEETHEVQAASMTAMRSGMAVEENEIIMKELNALKTVLKAMYLFKSHPPTQAKACGVLFAACVAKADFLRDQVREIEGIFPLVNSAMKLDPNRGVLQQDGCGILNVLIVDSIEIPQLEDSTRMLCAAMRNHANSSELQQEAIGATLNIITTQRRVTPPSGYQGETDEQGLILDMPLISFARNEGAIGLIIKAMVQHTPQELVCQRGVALLLALASNRDNEFMIAREGGTDAVKGAMTNHPYNPDLQVMACSLLRRLVDEDEFVAFVGGIGDANAAIENMKMYPENPQKLEAACVVLGVLVRVQPEKTVNIIKEQDAITLIINGMNTHNEDLKLYSMGLPCLASMALVPGMAAIIVKHGCLDLALKASLASYSNIAA